MKELLALTCPKCKGLMTEQPRPGLFLCRPCGLAYPFFEHGPNSIRWHQNDISVPIGDVEDASKQ